MNILFWTDGFWPRLGGIETQALEFILAMQKKGHKFTVIAQKDGSDLPYLGIEIHRFDFNRMIDHQELFSISSIQKLLLLTLPRIDLVHLNASVGGSILTFSLLKHLFKIPILATVHAPHPTIGKISSSLHPICCVSKWVLSEMGKDLPTLQHKLRLIYNGLSLPSAPPVPLCFSPPTLLIFGRLVKEKGFDVALKAFALVKEKRKDVKMIVAGEGPLKEQLESLSLELKIVDTVRFTGVLSPSELTLIYEQATLVIVPSFVESFGLVVLEAMQMGRPVIASRVEGIPEVVLEDVTGLLVEKNNPEELCTAILKLLNDPKKAAAMGAMGRERAKLFSIEENVRQYEQIYEELG